MHRFWLWICLALFPLPCFAQTDLGQFTEVTAGQYQVFAQGGPHIGRDVNSFMNLMLDQYSKFFSNWDRKAPARVVVLSNVPDFRTYVGEAIGLVHGGLTGLCHTKTDAQGNQFIELVAYQNDYLYRVLAHEGFHQFIRYEVGGNIPVWFNEGMAEYFETSYVLHGKLHVGTISRSTLQRAQAIIRREKGPTIEQLINMDRATFYANAQVTYPMAWALCYYLLQHDNRQYDASPVRKYVQDLKHGRDAVESFSIRFGRDSRKLQYDFSTYILRLTARFD